MAYGTTVSMVVCINLFFYIIFVDEFYAIHRNDDAARVTYFFSTLTFRLDILTTDFFTSLLFSLILPLQNNPLAAIREFFA